MGTLINVLGIVGGGLVGLVAGKVMNDRFRKTINVAMGLSVIALAISGMVAEMLEISQTANAGASSFDITTKGTYVIILSLVLGGIIGEIIDIDSQMERFGAWLKIKTGNAKDAAFIDAFVTASLTVCIGAMAVVGAIMDGINGDHSILITKAILDFVIIMAMTAGMGKGCIFSAIPVGIWQGSITLLATILAPIMTDQALSNLSMVGNILILCVGINILIEGRGRIRVANLMPAIIFAVVAAYIPFLG